MSAIYENAVDSLRIGMEFFLKEKNYSSRKHAILTLFHAIELFLKEQLNRTNALLIYKNIDAKITDDAQTVGIRESIARLENLGLGIPKNQKDTIENIQKIRNRIEHHRYDHNDKEDDLIIAESLRFILNGFGSFGQTGTPKKKIYLRSFLGRITARNADSRILSSAITTSRSAFTVT